ncbi:hypothetical protein RJ640_001169 [Escallonia rubra]|uniref:Uncharacterized protein n=1 Tax=Escallonia rubra TaxID=112253 RepID=A0AA88UD22_9ASTE|nr:hypothetical protein RJ640_001169 [Escallonia rubra]
MGLRYWCDKVFSPAHTRKHRQVSMLVVGEEEGEDTPPVYDEELPAQKEPVVEKEEDKVEITVHAITGTPSNNTFKLWGRHDSKVFSILIDTGSTHNFLDPNTANKLECVAVATTPMTIMVASGNRVTGDSMCQTFNSDMMILPLGGYDCVLGLQWLKTLGQVQFDFKAMTMTITKERKAITFQGGNRKTQVKLVSAEGMFKPFTIFVLDNNFKPISSVKRRFFIISTSAINSLSLFQPEGFVVRGKEEKQLEDGVSMSQKKYAIDPLKRFNMLNCKVVATPMNLNEKLQSQDGSVEDRKSTSGSVFILGSGVVS